MTKPLHAHWVIFEHVLRYLHGTINIGLRYTIIDVRLHGYIDVDWARNIDDRNITSGCCFSLGSAIISWMSRKQKYISLDTTEAEYIAASMDNYEAVWLMKLFGQLFD